MVFTDRGTRAVMKIFTARVRSTRAIKIHYSPSTEVSKTHLVPKLKFKFLKCTYVVFEPFFLFFGNFNNFLTFFPK